MGAHSYRRKEGRGEREKEGDRIFIFQWLEIAIQKHVAVETDQNKSSRNFRN